MMNTKKDRAQLQQEIDELRSKVAELEKSKLEFKDSEKYLSKLDERFKTFLESSDDLVFIVTRTGFITYVSPRVEFLYGYKPEELIGKHLKATTPIKEIPKAFKMLKKVFSGETLRNFEINQKRKDGLIIPMEINAVPIFENKKIIGFQGVLRDISERKKVEQELRVSEARFKSLYESLGDAVFVTKVGGKEIGKILEVNPAAVKQTGYSRTELLKMNIIEDLFIAGSADIDINEWEKKLKRGELVTVTEKKRRKDGTELWTKVNVTSIDYKGEQAALSINHDITELKEIGDKLQKEIDFSRILLQTSPAFYIAINAKGKVIMINETFLNVLGYREKEIIGKDYLAMIVPERDHKKLSEIFESLVGTRESTLNENYIRTKSGEELLVEWHGRPIFNEKGEFDFFFGLGIDISDRKRTEKIQQVLYNISFAVNLTENLDELIGVIRENLGILIDTTNFFVAIYEKETDTILLPYIADQKDTYTSFPAGKSFTAHVIKTRKPLLVTTEKLLEMESSGEVESVGSQSKIWLGVPMIINNIVTGAIVVQSYDDENAYDHKDLEMLEFVSHTISISIERKKAEQNLKNALEKATESDRLKSAFLATMSHELRTPLNAIIGFSDIINEDLPINDIIEFNKTINKSGNHLLSIVDDLFDITLIEAGQTKLDKKDENLLSILQEVLSIIKAGQYNTNKSNLKLNLKTPSENDDLIINTDSSKLKQVLINLLKNGLKFTNEGYVEFGYTYEKAANDNVLNFYVKDTGIGIPESKIGLVFDIFRQAEESYTKIHGGTGIGLTISKKLIELLGGFIWVESKEENKSNNTLGGTTFFFTLPYSSSKKSLKITIQKEKVSLKSTNLKSKSELKTILIVEDDASSFEFLKIILSKHGYKHLWAKEGESAVEMCKENASIDLVLMDINMPVLNGYDATKIIKSFKPELPIIAQTAFSIMGDRQKSLDSGCDDYISKPIDKELLFEKMSALLDL